MDKEELQELKNIPVERIAEYFGGTLSHTDGRKNLWYHSPFRPDESTASFKIDPYKNTWHDFARIEKHNAHGNGIDLWIDYQNLSRSDPEAFKGAIEFLRGFAAAVPIPKERPKRPKDPYKDRYKLIKLSDNIWHDSLKNHAIWRGLDVKYIRHIKQAFIEDTETGNKFNGFAMENVKGGLEVSIPNVYTNETFKNCIGAKAPSVIEPTKAGGYKWAIFEGMWDMATWQKMTADWEEYGIVCLHSTSNAGMLAELIPQADQMLLFMDNDDAGEQAELFICDQFPKAGSMRHLYEGYKDLSKKWQDAPKERLALSQRSTTAPRLKL